jgi:hypothetical protein
MKKTIFLLLFAISAILFFPSYEKDCDCDCDPEPSPNNNTTNCTNYKLTSGKYSEYDDIYQAVEDELGSNYDVADWNNIKSISDVAGWCDCMNLSDHQTFMVVKGGQHFYCGDRHYFIEYFDDGVPSSGFLVHDQVGGNMLCLGSWYGLDMKVLGKK